MVRPYAVKGKKKLKKRPRIEEEEEEEVEEQNEVAEEENDGAPEEARDGGENPAESTVEGEKKADEAIDQMPGIPVAVGLQESRKKPGVIFVLERACLEYAKVGKTFQILNSDDHANFLKKQNRNPADYRPDIIHQALLTILDSPLTKAGRLQALYVRTEKGVLFEVKPHVRMPRTFKRFCGLMLQLLQNLSITAAGKREKLLNVIKNPVTRHLPVNSRRIGLSYSSPKVVQMRDYVAAASDDVNLVFVVGAMAHGNISNDYTDDFISSSNQRLATGGAPVAVLVVRRGGMDTLRDLLERGESFEKGGSFGGWGEIEVQFCEKFISWSDSVREAREREYAYVGGALSSRREVSELRSRIEDENIDDRMREEYVREEQEASQKLSRSSERNLTGNSLVKICMAIQALYTEKKKDAIESASRYDESSATHVGEFVDKLRQETSTSDTSEVNKDKTHREAYPGKQYNRAWCR